jgi:hypothetical protein
MRSRLAVGLMALVSSTYAQNIATVRKDLNGDGRKETLTLTAEPVPTVNVGQLNEQPIYNTRVSLQDGRTKELFWFELLGVSRASIAEYNPRVRGPVKSPYNNTYPMIVIRDDKRPLALITYWEERFQYYTREHDPFAKAEAAAARPSSR